MKVLLLTVSAGYGHTSTAKSIENALAERGIQAKTVDAYKYVNSLLSQTLDKSTAFYAKMTPDIYRLVYEYLDKGVQDERINVLALANSLCSIKFEKLIKEYKPDVVVCTHVFAAQLMSQLKKHGKTEAKLIGIVTDYTIHPYWETVPEIDYYVIASDKLVYRAVKKGIPEEKIRAFGIPINDKFLKSIDKKRARKELGLSEDKRIVLIMGGGLGYGFGTDDIAKIAEMHEDIEIVIICGKSKRTVKKLENFKWETGYKNIKVYGFMDNVDVFMSAADILISKPGGLSVSEAFAKKLPILMSNPLAGQEERNAEFMMNFGLALFTNKTYPLDEVVNLMLSDESVLTRIKNNIDFVIPKNAVKSICDFIEKQRQ